MLQLELCYYVLDKVNFYINNWCDTNFTIIYLGKRAVAVNDRHDIYFSQLLATLPKREFGYYYHLVVMFRCGSGLKWSH